MFEGLEWLYLISENSELWNQAVSHKLLSQQSFMTWRWKLLEGIGQAFQWKQLVRVLEGLLCYCWAVCRGEQQRRWKTFSKFLPHISVVQACLAFIIYITVCFSCSLGIPCRHKQSYETVICRRKFRRALRVKGQCLMGVSRHMRTSLCDVIILQRKDTHESYTCMDR